MLRWLRQVGWGGLLQRLRWPLIALFTLVLLPLWAVVTISSLLINPRSLSRDQWLTPVQDLRTTILQSPGGVAVAFGAIVAARNFRETSRQNRAVQERNRAVHG